MTDFTYPELQDLIIVAEDISFEAYLTQFNGQNTEWHAGKVVQKMSNNERHQLILGFIFTLLTLYLSSKKSGRVFLAGFPMYISDDVPAREPDLMVVLNHKLEKVTETYLDGPADVVCEVVSPRKLSR